MRLRDMLPRRKQQETPLQKLTQLYNEIENDYLNNLSMQQNGRMKEALVGWQMLHDKLADKFGKVRSQYADTILAKGESFLMDEIAVMEKKTDDWLVWMGNNYVPAVRKSTSSSSSANPFDDSFSATRENSMHSRTLFGGRARKKPPPGYVVENGDESPSKYSSKYSSRYSSKPLLKHSSKHSSKHSLKHSSKYSSTNPSEGTSTNPSEGTDNPSKYSSMQSSIHSTHTEYSPKYTERPQMPPVHSSTPSLHAAPPYTRNRSSPVVLTLRQKQKSRPPTATKTRMLKSLRGAQPTQADASSPAKYAANLIWSPTPSLGSTGRSRSPERPQLGTGDPFEGFDSSFVPEKAEGSGNAAEEDVVAGQMRALDVRRKKREQSDRVKSALEKSAAVRLNVPAPRPVYRRHSAQKRIVGGTKSGVSQKGCQKGCQKSGQKIREGTPKTQEGTKSPKTHKGPKISNEARKDVKTDKELVLSGQDNPTKDTENLKELEESTNDEKTPDNDRMVARNGTVMSKKKIVASLRGVDEAAARQILDEIVVNGDEVHWEDIAGLEEAKKSLKEAVVYPFLRPDLFSGLREPARGMLLFGPPGTGKTMLARAVATESQSTFFSISASSLTSKYLGESEKLVRALFQLARKMAPSIIFVDEIDSLLGTRDRDGENEASRRIKNEFLVQWSNLTKAAAGKDTGEDVQRVLVLAATNLPWGIDDAARRRFVRRQYIPLPQRNTRRAQLETLLMHQKHTLSEVDFDALLDLTRGFSGSDITALAKDAAMGPLRELGDRLLMTNKSEIRPLKLKDFVCSLRYIKPSVSQKSLARFEEWAKVYGSSGA